MYLRLKKLKNPMKKKKLFWNKKSQLVFAESVMITCGCMLLGVAAFIVVRGRKHNRNDQ